MSNDVEEKAAADRQPKRIVARRPQRKPGQVRFRKLLDALDELLATSNVQDIGLYQIAAKAKVPNASVYHFFPSTEAALLAARQARDASRLPGQRTDLAEPDVAAALRRNMEEEKLDHVLATLPEGAAAFWAV